MKEPQCSQPNPMPAEEDEKKLAKIKPAITPIKLPIAFRAYSVRVELLVVVAGSLAVVVVLGAVVEALVEEVLVAAAREALGKRSKWV